jgi:N-acetylglucosaminyl-diphospho-decaprenol L-rhamnosyltransferase
MSRTTIVTVAYNSAAALPGLLASLPDDTRMIVVDNASTDGSADLVRAAGHEVVALSRNAGFGRACNAGAARADSPFLFFVNPDIVLDSGCVDALEAAADRIPALLAANPRLQNRAGQVDFKTSSVLLPKTSAMSSPPDRSMPVPVLSGAALFCRREAFEAADGFDPAIFLYHEDHDLAVRIGAASPGSLWWIHEAIAMHDAGTGSPRIPAVGWLKGYHMARSRHYALRKHGRPESFAGRLAGYALALGMPHNLFSARRRAKHLGQIAGLWSTRADGGADKPS